LEIATGHNPLSANASDPAAVLGEETIQSLQELASANDLDSVQGNINSFLSKNGLTPEELKLPEIPDSELKIKENASPKDLEGYFNSAAAIVAKFMPVENMQGLETYLIGINAYSTDKFTDIGIIAL